MSQESIPAEPILFTPEELTLLGDEQFFRAKAQYKKNLMTRYGGVADQGLALCLGGTPWEWKRGEGYTMELTWERKNELMALLDRRSFVKVARFVPFDHPTVREGRVPDLGRATLRQLLPIITP